jgi:hypothetical protein
MKETAQQMLMSRENGEDEDMHTGKAGSFRWTTKQVRLRGCYALSIDRLQESLNLHMAFFFFLLFLSLSHIFPLVSSPGDSSNLGCARHPAHGLLR